MNFKFLTITIFSFVFIIGIKKILNYLYYFEEVTFPQQSNNSANTQKSGPYSKKNILIVNSAEGIVGGGEIYTINLYRKLFKNAHNVKLLIVKNSGLEKHLQKLKIPYFAYNKFSVFKTSIQPGLSSAMLKICKDQNIQIIHCNIHRETTAARKVAKKLPVKVVLTRHIPQPVKPKYLNNVDGIIAVSSQIKERLEQEITKNKISNKLVVTIPPFFDEEKFLNFKPSNIKELFFKENFNIELQNLPTLCLIANMYKDLNHKNHPLILNAIHNLVYKKQKPVQLILVGQGEMLNFIKQNAQDLKIQNHVYFLGTSDKVAEILYHSDIALLVGKEEGLGIVLLEAALLKKPLIGTTNTGMVDIVKHNQTGLLFENNNLESLVDQIEKLLDNPFLQKKLGENAYQFVKENFSSENSLQKLIEFYKKILKI